MDKVVDLPLCNLHLYGIRNFYKRESEIRELRRSALMEFVRRLAQYAEDPKTPGFESRRPSPRFFLWLPNYETYSDISVHITSPGSERTNFPTDLITTS